jgi:hypothetical protein
LVAASSSAKAREKSSSPPMPGEPEAAEEPAGAPPPSSDAREMCLRPGPAWCGPTPEAAAEEAGAPPPRGLLLLPLLVPLANVEGSPSARSPEGAGAGLRPLLLSSRCSLLRACHSSPYPYSLLPPKEDEEAEP